MPRVKGVIQKPTSWDHACWCMLVYASRFFLSNKVGVSTSAFY